MMQDPQSKQPNQQQPFMGPPPVPTGVGNGGFGQPPATQAPLFSAQSSTFQQGQPNGQMQPGLPQGSQFNTSYPSWNSQEQVGQKSPVPSPPPSGFGAPAQPNLAISGQQPPNANFGVPPGAPGQQFSPQPLQPPVNPNIPTQAPLSPIQNPPGEVMTSPQKLTMQPQGEEQTPIKDPIIYLSSSVAKEKIDGVDYSYFFAGKQNNTGTTYNLRFFLVDQDQLAYSTKFDPKVHQVPFGSRAKLPKIKEQCNWENITLENPKKNIMKVTVQLAPPKGKKVWFLKTKDDDMMLVIYTLFYDAKSNKERRLQQQQQLLQQQSPTSPEKAKGPEEAAKLNLSSSPYQSVPNPNAGQQFGSPQQLGQAPNIPPMAQGFGNPSTPQKNPNVPPQGQPQDQRSVSFGMNQPGQNIPGQPMGPPNTQVPPSNFTSQGPNQPFQQAQGQEPVSPSRGPPLNQFNQPPSQINQQNQFSQPANQSNIPRQDSTGQPVGQFNQYGQQGSPSFNSQGPQPSSNIGASNFQSNAPNSFGQPQQSSFPPNQYSQPPNQFSQQSQYPQQPNQVGQQNEPNQFGRSDSPQRPPFQEGQYGNPPIDYSRGYSSGNASILPTTSIIGSQQQFGMGSSSFNAPPPSETDILKENFKRLDSQTRSGLRDNLIPPASPINQPNLSQSQYYQDFRRLFSTEIEQRKKILYTDNQNWNYQFAKGDEENVTLSFKTFAQALVADIIDDMNERQANYRPSEDLSETESIITYKDYQGVEVRLCFTAVKEYRLLKESKESVLEEAAIKAAYREFNNMDYLMQLTRNKGKIRLPLVAIVEYKGIVAFVKASIPIDTNKAPKSLLKDLELIARQSRVKDTIFEDDRAVVISPLQSKFYEKLARQENSPLTRQPNAFDLYYLESVRHFLPADLQFAAKDPENYILRPEFVQRSEFVDASFLGENLKKYLGKQKVPRDIQQAIRQLDDNEKYIVRLVGEFVKDVEETDEMLGSSEDITYLMHKRGLNLRYLGLVYSTAKAPFVRKACMSEIAARCAKAVLQYDLQSFVRNANMSKKNSQADSASTTDSMLDYAIDFLNSVVGSNQDSNEIWIRLNKQALYEFNIPLLKQEIAEGHFVQALLHHCNVRCGYRYEMGDKLFLRNVFERNRESTFNVRSRVYSLKFTDLYRRVQSILDNPVEDSFEQLKSLLNLRKLDLPKHMKLDGTYDWVAVFLSTMVPPRGKEGASDSLPCSTLYQSTRKEIINLASFHIALTEIKWDLQNERVEDALLKKDQLERRIIRWFGDVHPSLTELYNVFAVYFVNKCKFDEAMKYAKSSLANNSNLLGNNSLKTAESHYDLANIFMKASKREEALSYFRKAKNIFDNKSATERLSYAEIEIRIAALDLYFDRFEEAETFALHAVGIFEAMENHETEMVDAYQLISRIYEVRKKKDQLAKTAEYCGQLLADIQTQANLEKMIKIVLLPMLNDLPSGLAGKFLQLVQSIPYTYNNSNQTNALTTIKELIKKGIFVDKMQNYMNSLDETLQAINNNGLLARWRGLETEVRNSGQEFIAIVESLVYLLGEGFLSGALTGQ